MFIHKPLNKKSLVFCSALHLGDSARLERSQRTKPRHLTQENKRAEGCNKQAKINLKASGFLENQRPRPPDLLRPSSILRRPDPDSSHHSSTVQHNQNRRKKHQI
jgi:hypothetical protein